MNLLSPQVRRLTFIDLYRRILRSNNRILDREISVKIMKLVKSSIYQSKSTSEKRLVSYYKSGEIAAKFLSRCAQGHQNSLQQLIRIYTDTTPLNFTEYMRSRPMKELELRPDYIRLTETEKNLVRAMAMKCCQSEEKIYKNLTEYVFDTKSEDSWDWDRIPVCLSQQLSREIREKVDKHRSYHSQYRHAFQSHLQFRQVVYQDIVEDLQGCDYWAL